MAPRIQFDFTSIDPRWRAIMIGGIVVIVLAIIGLIFLRPNGNQTANVTATSTLSPTPSLAATPTLAGPPTETLPPAATATLAPYEWVVQPGDTLYFIIQQFNYRDLSVVSQVIAMNGMSSENDLIAGETIYIPRQTPTVGPTFTASPTLDPLISPTVTNTPGPTRDPNATLAPDECTPEFRCPTSDGRFWIHIVREGDTIASIAHRYVSTIQCLRQENALSGDNLSVGQELKVCILVTQTPTLTPTGGPDSTATPLPTPMNPMLLAPAADSTIARNQNVILQWASSRPLAQGQSYMVIITNTTSGEETRLVTRTNSMRVPDSLRPNSGSVIYQWRVVIINGSTTNSTIVSGQGEPYAFQWGS